MEIEGFDSIISTVTLAKELYDTGRYDIVKEQFFDILSWDCYYENILGAISSVFSGFCSNFDDNDEVECMIFSDEYISRYYEIAWEYSRSHNVRHDENPYIIAAENEACRWLSFCYSTGFKLLGYSKTKKTARQSKLIVYVGMCECDCHRNLAYGLVQLYKFFRGKCAEFDNRVAVSVASTENNDWKEAMAA